MKRQCMILVLVGAFLLSSCSPGSGIPMQTETSTTLPPAANAYVAPIGDAALEYTAKTVLYLPRHDSTRLVALTVDVNHSAARPDAESITRALLNFEGNGIASRVGGNVQLSLYGANPVEISNGVATVNLAASALQLYGRAYYIACQAIANTLTELKDIHAVNILVMDKPIGLDIASTLPTGTLSRSVGEDIGAVYEQLLSQRVASGEDAASKRLSSTVTLYFPLSGVDGIMSEARNISFDSQRTPDMIRQILSEMALGSQSLSNAPSLPLLADLLTEPPIVAEPNDGSGKQVTLRFAYNFDDMLQTYQVSRASCMAALCYTLSTFLPNMAGLTVYIGDERVNELTLGNGDVLSFPEAIQRRADYALFLMDHCTLYFASENHLVAVQRAVYFSQVHNPRALILELAKGPQASDHHENLEAVFPTEVLHDADILGISLNDNTLLVNFSKSFQQLGTDLTPQQDRLLAYALVNTLFCNDRVEKVRFFIIGDVPTSFSGEIYWQGDFYQNLGLVVQP